MTITAGQTITIEGHHGAYIVRRVFGEDGGTYTLTLDQTTPPYGYVVLDHVHERDGTLYTEQLEEIAPMDEPVVEREQVQLELF